MQSFSWKSFIVLKLFNLEISISKGHNSWINASRVMTLVSRVGPGQVNMYVEFQLNILDSVEVILATQYMNVFWGWKGHNYQKSAPRVMGITTWKLHMTHRLIIGNHCAKLFKSIQATEQTSIFLLKPMLMKISKGHNFWTENDTVNPCLHA